MNIRKIKLALTVDLMNLAENKNPVRHVREAMAGFQKETGGFKGYQETQKSQISDNLRKTSLALLFEHCTLNLELVTDLINQKEFIQGFNILENLS